MLLRLAWANGQCLLCPNCPLPPLLPESPRWQGGHGGLPAFLCRSQQRAWQEQRAFSLPHEARSLPPSAGPMQWLHPAVFCPQRHCPLQSSNPLETGCCLSHLLKSTSCSLLPTVLQRKHQVHFVSEPNQKPHLTPSDFAHLCLTLFSAHFPGVLKA